MMFRFTRALLIAAAGGAIAMGAMSPTSAQDKPKREKGMKKALTFEVYKDKADEFRWRLKAGNGQNIGSSGQGYGQKSDCMHAIDVIKEGAAKAVVKEAMDSDKDK
jgi:hypothetical protein